jgi:thiamine biosynthesis lipoprotein
MSTDIIIKCFSQASRLSKVGLDNLVDAALEVFHKIAFDFSRFKSQGELSRVNQQSQKDFIEVSEQFMQLLDFSIKLARFSDGLYDPTVTDLLESIGYDRSFKEIQIEQRSSKQAKAKSKTKLNALIKNRPSWKEIQIIQSSIKLQPDQRLDFGGIGKGYAIDKAAEVLLKYSDDFLIDAGGDVFAKGRNLENGKNWTVNLKVFDGSESQLDQNVKRFNYKIDPLGEAVASSGRVFRRFGDYHHIVNPKRLESRTKKSEVVQTFVKNRHALVADGLSTLLFVGGKAFVDKIQKEFNSECLVLYSNGKIFLTETFNIY